MPIDPAEQIHQEFPSVSPRLVPEKIMSTPEGQFLHQRDPSLHRSGPVKLAVSTAKHEGHRLPNEPGAKINAYLGKLAGHSLIAEIPRDDPARAAQLIERRKKQIDVRVIKPRDIPDSFWETQKRTARERGHGDIDISEDLRAEAIRVLQTDQRESLRDWLEYISDKESNYPTWFKYFVLNGVTKLADYDKEKDEFPRRSKSTTDPFPGLNREALAYVYDKIEDRLQGKPADNTELDELLKQANFAKLYAKSLAEIGFADPELLKEIRGTWVKYAQSDNPNDVRRLSESLKGYGTGWCTAGEGYARTQLAGGDFYVFYSRDKDGVNRVPRIAIRTEDGQVAEVRGIVGGSPNMGPAENNRQELEPEMIDLAMAKLKELPGGQEYQQRAADMRHLTEIEKKVKTDPGTQLSHEDINFLYEFDHTIQGFGYDRDPRIAEIREKRGKLDYPEILPILKESIYKQAAASLEAVNTLIDQLNQQRRHNFLVGWNRLELVTSADLRQLLNTKISEWEGNGSLDWAVEQMIEGAGGINLVATPNFAPTKDELMDLARKFGEGQPSNTYIDEQLYEHYSAEQLSGQIAGNANVRLSLIPSGNDPRFYGTVEQQRSKLAEQHRKLPSLRVPSVLDAISYWQTLRAGGDELVDYKVFGRTYIRHFDLPEKQRARVGDWPLVPGSYVRDDGEPLLYGSGAGAAFDGRLAVG